MATQILQHILDELTDVHLPREMAAPPINEHVEIAGIKVPVYRYPAVVLQRRVGLRAAVELKRRGVDVLSSPASCSGAISAFPGPTNSRFCTPLAPSTAVTISRCRRRHWAAVVPWMPTSPTSKRSARSAPLPDEVSRACRCRKIDLAQYCVTRPTMMNSAGPPVVGRVPLA